MLAYSQLLFYLSKKNMKLTLLVGLIMGISQNVSGLGVADCGKPVIPPR